MKDTPDHVYQKQLEIWLSKTPAERLKQTLMDNDDLYRFWNEMKEKNKVIGNKLLSDDSKKDFTL